MSRAPKPGEVVVFQGFLARQKLNGRTGTVVKHVNGDHHDSESGRLRVHLHGTPFTLKVPAQSLGKPQTPPLYDPAQVGKGIIPSTPPTDLGRLTASSPRDATKASPRRRPLREPIIGIHTKGHQPCGEVYAKLQQSGCGRDPKRLRNLGLAFFKDTHAEAPRRLRPMPPRTESHHIIKGQYDWRTPQTRFIDPSQVPHEMGGHGPEMFDASYHALISPRYMPPNSQLEAFMDREKAAMPWSPSERKSPKAAEPGGAQPLFDGDADASGLAEVPSPGWATTRISQMSESEWPNQSKAEESTAAPESMSHCQEEPSTSSADAPQALPDQSTVLPEASAEEPSASSTDAPQVAQDESAQPSEALVEVEAEGQERRDSQLNLMELVAETAGEESTFSQEYSAPNTDAPISSMAGLEVLPEQEPEGS